MLERYFQMKTFGVAALYANEIRCKKCKRLLMKGEIKDIEIKCPKCGYIQTIREKGREVREVGTNYELCP